MNPLDITDTSRFDPDYSGLKEVFFFYLSGKQGGLLLEQVIDLEDTNSKPKWEAIDELIRIEILQTNTIKNQSFPYYELIQYQWLTRLAKTNFPKNLLSPKDLSDYYTYLHFYTQPAVKQLKSAYAKLNLYCIKSIEREESELLGENNKYYQEYSISLKMRDRF